MLDRRAASVSGNHDSNRGDTAFQKPTLIRIGLTICQTPGGSVFEAFSGPPATIHQSLPNAHPLSMTGVWVSRLDGMLICDDETI